MACVCVCVYGSGLVELCGLSECEWYAWHVCVCVRMEVV